jgi:lactoylglutathione lyase
MIPRRAGEPVGWSPVEGKIDMKVNYVIVFVSDMPRSLAFYRDVIGLPLRFESPGWTEFATDGATLALHQSGSATGHDRSRAETAGECRPGLQVPDLDAFHRRMVERQVRCIQEPNMVFGSRVALYADPDGLAISVGEHRATKREGGATA